MSASPLARSRVTRQLSSKPLPKDQRLLLHCFIERTELSNTNDSANGETQRSNSAVLLEAVFRG